MASILTQVRRYVKRAHPITVRHVDDIYDARTVFQVRIASVRPPGSERRSLDSLGQCSENHRKAILQMCEEGGYTVDELVEGRHWLCHPPSEAALL